MTRARDEILALSGRDLDRAVAEARGDKHIDGWWESVDGHKSSDSNHADGGPNSYHDDITAAMRLLGEITEAWSISFDGEWYWLTRLEREEHPIPFATLADLPSAIARVWLMLREG